MIFLGLDNAGKTTLLGFLKDGHLRSARPTQQPNQEELVLDRLSFKTFDLGGHKSARVLWKDYCIDADVIVFLVDATDRDRFAEAKEELDGLLKMDEFAQVPILVLGNKIDLRTAVSEQELRAALGLYATTGKGTVKVDAPRRPLELFMCSVVRKTGFAEGFRWASQYVKGK